MMTVVDRGDSGMQLAADLIRLSLFGRVVALGQVQIIQLSVE
jgi:hypothetical protein